MANSTHKPNMRFNSITDEWEWGTRMGPRIGNELNDGGESYDFESIPTEIQGNKKSQKVLPLIFLSDAEKIKKFDLVSKDKERIQKDYENVQRAYDKIRQDFSRFKMEAGEILDYKRALERTQQEFNEFRIDYDKKYLECKKLAERIDEFSERTVSAETDVAEENSKNRVRQGLIKQLFGYFSWRLKNKSPKRNILTDTDLKKIISILDRILEKTEKEKL